jgi:hypothetical protein
VPPGGPPSIGGETEFLVGGSAAAEGSDRSSTPLYAAIAGAAALAITVGGWYAGRHFRQMRIRP